MTELQAHQIAETLLLHVLQDPELLSGLLGRSGLDPTQLRAVAESKDFHEFVMDYIVETDDRVISIADMTGLGASNIAMAARVLSRRDD